MKMTRKAAGHYFTIDNLGREWFVQSLESYFCDDELKGWCSGWVGDSDCDEFSSGYTSKKEAVAALEYYLEINGWA